MPLQHIVYQCKKKDLFLPLARIVRKKGALVKKKHILRSWHDLANGKPISGYVVLVAT